MTYFFRAAALSVPLMASAALGDATAETILSGNLGADHGHVGVASEGLIGLSGEWTRSDDGDQIFALGIGPTLPLGPLRLTAQAKGIYLDIGGGRQNLRDGVGAALHAGARWEVSPALDLFANVAIAPASLLPSRANEYRMATAGVRFQVLEPLHLQAGYRYEAVEGSAGYGNVRLADDFFIGAALKF